MSSSKWTGQPPEAAEPPTEGIAQVCGSAAAPRDVPLRQRLERLAGEANDGGHVALEIGGERADGGHHALQFRERFVGDRAQCAFGSP